MQDEDELLAGALAAVGGTVGGRWGAGAAAKRLRKNVHEIELRLPLAFEEAEAHVRRVLTSVGQEVDPVPPDSGTGARTVRVFAGGGVGGMNPVLVTAVVTGAEAGASGVRLRAAAKEGLIRQRAGERTAKRIAALLTG